MGHTDIIAIFAIMVVVGGAVLYLIRAKRRGERCVGCPYSKTCGGSCSHGDNAEKVESMRRNEDAENVIKNHNSK